MSCTVPRLPVCQRCCFPVMLGPGSPEHNAMLDLSSPQCDPPTQPNLHNTFGEKRYPQHIRCRPTLGPHPPRLFCSPNGMHICRPHSALTLSRSVGPHSQLTSCTHPLNTMFCKSCTVLKGSYNFPSSARVPTRKKSTSTRTRSNAGGGARAACQGQQRSNLLM